MEKFSEHIVENKEEVKDVVATNEEKKLEAEEDFDQHCDISVEWKWKSSVLVINEEEVKVATIALMTTHEAEEDLDHNCDISINVEDHCMHL